jgi:hypothetical protein
MHIKMINWKIIKYSAALIAQYDKNIVTDMRCVGAYPVAP